MKKLDALEQEILDAYEKGDLKSTETPSRLAQRSGGAAQKRTAL
jgi:hypothetical protein